MRFLCRIGWHKWYKLSDRYKVPYYSYDVFGGDAVKLYLNVQCTNCSKCNKYKEFPV